MSLQLTILTHIDRMLNWISEPVSSPNFSSFYGEATLIVCLCTFPPLISNLSSIRKQVGASKKAKNYQEELAGVMANELGLEV